MLHYNSSAARRVEIVYVNLSVRHTDTDKSASILSVSFRRSSHTLDPICDRADNYVFWTFLRGLCGLPPEKYATLHCQSRPKRRTKWQYFFMHIFLPLRLGGFAFAPPSKKCNIALSVTPQKANKMTMLLYALISTPLASCL